MPPFLENLTERFGQFGGLNELFQQGQFVTLLLLLFAYLIFRRVFLFSLTGLLPILLIVGLLFSQDSGVKRVFENAGAGGGFSLGDFDIYKYGLVALVILFLFGGSRLFMPMRGMSLGTGLLIVGLVLLLFRREIQFPGGVESAKTVRMICYLFAALVIWKVGQGSLWRWNMGWQVRHQKRLAKAQLDTQVQAQKAAIELQALSQLAQTNPQAYFELKDKAQKNLTATSIGKIYVWHNPSFWWLVFCISVFLLVSLYFWPTLLSQIPIWKVEYAPFIFALALCGLSVALIRLAKVKSS